MNFDAGRVALTSPSQTLAPNEAASCRLTLLDSTPVVIASRSIASQSASPGSRRLARRRRSSRWTSSRNDSGGISCRTHIASLPRSSRRPNTSGGRERLVSADRYPSSSSSAASCRLIWWGQCPSWTDRRSGRVFSLRPVAFRDQRHPVAFNNSRMSSRRGTTECSQWQSASAAGNGSGAWDSGSTGQRFLVAVRARGWLHPGEEKRVGSNRGPAAFSGPGIWWVRYLGDCLADRGRDSVNRPSASRRICSTGSRVAGRISLRTPCHRENARQRTRLGPGSPSNQEDDFGRSATTYTHRLRRESRRHDQGGRIRNAAGH